MIARARLAVAFALAAFLAAVPGGPLGATEPMRIAGQTLEAGQYRIGTMTPTCGGARTFLSRELRDYGASVPGTIVLNPQRLSPLPVATQAFVYAHECGHQIYGASEPAADCHAARSGAREGWLNLKDASRICRMLPEAGSSRAYGSRDVRCDIIRACLAGAVRPARFAATRSYEEARLRIAGQ